jgi:hypothetical protein
MDPILFVFAHCNALMLMLAAIVVYREMDLYGYCALGRRRTL